MTDGQLVVAQILWDVALFIVIAIIVPLVLFRAARLVRACRNIATEFKVTLAAAGGVAANTQPTGPALDQTIGIASRMVATASQIDQHSGAIESLLRQRAAGGGNR